MLPAIRQRAPACAFLSAVLLVGLWIAPHGVAQCESCGTSPEESVFDVWQSGLNPYTLGLPVGAWAPEISGFGVPGELTLLVAINSTCNPEYLGLIELWGRELPELRIVALLTGLNRGLKASFIAALGSAVHIVTEPDSTVLCAQYQVGDRASPVTFLIDRSGTIVYRRWSFSNRTAMEFDGIVRHFAQTSALPEGTLQQQVLWYGDPVHWPDFPLRDGEGNEVFLGSGRPLLLYSGSEIGRDAPAYNDITTMIEVYGEGVEFVLLARTLTEEDCLSIWTFGRLVGLDAAYPEFYAIDFDTFLASMDLAAREAEFEEKEQRFRADGWRVLYDDRWRLGFSWLIYAAPSVTVVDANGVLAFPCTAYPVSSLTGEYVAAEGAAEELRGILDGLLPPS